jgi:H+-transporting ATPase
VSVKFGDGPWQFIGILPMLDPPRHDSGQTVKNLQHAGIRVKMITGDHLNIAKETARLIGMGTNICPGEDTRVASNARDQLIWDADGFAQVQLTHRHHGYRPRHRGLCVFFALCLTVRVRLVIGAGAAA